jgi:pimeloyl-ACP methyl ester carboxylesterase
MIQHAPSARPTLLFIHGLWMTGTEAFAFRRRMERDHGFDTAVFAYRTTQEPLDAVVDRLREQIDRLQARCLHIAAHSLGGLVALNYLARHHAVTPPGRLVLLGSPVKGSAAARKLGGSGLGRRLIGPVATEVLLAAWRRDGRDADAASREDPSRGDLPRDTGVIAGTRPMGLGRWIAGFDEPNDGTVAVVETELDGARDRLVLPVSHLGMLMSPRVAAACGHFFREGRFPLGA